MSFQVIEFLSLFSLFLSGVMIVPRGTTDDTEEAMKCWVGFCQRQHWSDCNRLLLRRVIFLLGMSQRVLKWFFELPTQIYLYLQLSLSWAIDL